jgi:hypothetical protein
MYAENSDYVVWFYMYRVPILGLLSTNYFTVLRHG